MPSSQGRVIVIGSGAAGMAAAVAAAAGGASVSLLEAAPRLGGTTATSGGGAWFPANRWAASAGVEDSSAQALRYIAALGIGPCPDHAATFVEDSGRVADLIEERTPLRWSHLVGRPDYHPELDGGSAGGRSVEVNPFVAGADIAAQVRGDPYGLPPVTVVETESASPPDDAEIERRRRSGIMARGRGLVAGLCAAFLEMGGKVETEARVTRLVRRGDAVGGVEVRGGELRGQVIIASGGFERDSALVSAFLRGPMLAPGGVPTNVGDGLRLGASVGASLANMSEAWWVAATQIPGETIDGAPFYRMLFGEAPQPGGLVVDSRGQRFANEAVSYYSFGRGLHQRNEDTLHYDRATSWLIFDAQRRADGGIGPLRGDDADPQWLRSRATVADLARAINIEPAALVATVERFNAGAARGDDTDFGRGSFAWDRLRHRAGTLRALTEPPFYGLQVMPGCSGTNGGVRTDDLGRVLRAEDGAVIPGLFAAGNAAAYPFGLRYPGPGATIGPAIVFGWRAGETAARQ
jgi:3-oxosteroid 1-dehydrogenase